MQPHAKAKKILSGQVRLPAELDRAIDVEAAKRGCYKYEIIERLWARRFRGTGQDAEQSGGTKVGEMLAAIMASGVADAFTAVRATLRVFFRHIGGDPDGDLTGHLPAGNERGSA